MPEPLVPFADEPAFVFRTDLSEAAPGPVLDDGALSFALGADVPVDRSGGRAIQRSEIAETHASDDANTDDGPAWYRFALKIDPATALPEAGAKLHLAQFHQRDGLDGAATKPAMMLNLTGAGDLVLQFETAVGKRAHTLVEGGLFGDGALGHWIEVVIGADWRASGGWTEVHLRQEGESAARLAVFDTGPNTSTGHVFFKAGLYRSFLDRDPGLEDAPAGVTFRDFARADSLDAVLGQPAAFGLADGFEFLATPDDSGHYGSGGAAALAPIPDDLPGAWIGPEPSLDPFG